MSSSIFTCSGRPPTPPLAYPLRPPLEAVGRSHPGLARAVNEDAYLVAPDDGLFAVADGIGGGAAGEIASRMALDVLHAHVEDPALSGDGLRLLTGASREANARVLSAGRANRGWAGMGTTLAALLVQGRRAAIAHAGDSRAYRLRGTRLDLCTEDHTVVRACLNAGLMTADEAKGSGVRHVITRAVGTHETVEVDARWVSAEPGDTFLLSSDGLHGVTGDEEIGAMLLAERDLGRAAAELVQSALDRGGPDNVTVVLVRIG